MRANTAYSRPATLRSQAADAFVRRTNRWRMIFDPIDTMAESNRNTFVVFPFLKTSAPVVIGGITFRSTEDTGTLTNDQAEHVRHIADMLFLQDDLRIRSASYAIVPFIELDRTTSDLDHLANVQAIVAYCYAAPHEVFGDPFLSAEHASLALFNPQNVSIFLISPEHHVYSIGADSQRKADDRHEVSGYSGLYNFRDHFWVSSGSRLYGPRRHLTLNISQDLSADLGQRLSDRPDYDLLPRLLTTPATATSERILTAVKWFNAANSGATDDASAIVNLAIAFETLLSLPETEKKTERLTDAISLLLGRLPRLDVWARQFYQTRSEIVHEGRARQLRFVATASKKGWDGPLYHPLLSDGHQVFQLCVASLLVGARLAERAGLEDKLVTNQERFERICRTLTDQSATAADRLRQCVATVAAIDRYRFVWESGLKIETMLAASRMAAQALIALDSRITVGLRERLDRFAAVKTTADHYEQLDALRELQEVLPNVESQPELDLPQGAVLRLIEVVWGYTFMHYYWVKQRREAPVQ